ncbi:MAG: S9 family peptidase [Chitinophagaceae bacterium]|nr:S9 family peptidase [Chitinophagaceae bacterium]
MTRRFFKIIFLLIITVQLANAQRGIKWMPDGNAYMRAKDGGIVKIDPKTEAETVLIKKDQLVPAGSAKALSFQSYQFNSDNSKLMIFTNTAKVWRYNTRGDYWVLDITTNTLTRLGKDRPSQSLMFAKFSPDGRKVAYVSEHNLFVEDAAGGNISQLTFDGSRKMINGTFDWVYEEEFGCRDGFRWSPDGKQIAFWQVDATKIRDFFMINNTDSNYSKVIPVEYPKVGESPSPVRIGVIGVSGGQVKWMQVEGDPQQHYIPRMDWTAPGEIILQQLDRKQQHSKLIYCNSNDGSSRPFWQDEDKAWVDLNSADIFGEPGGFDWINKGQEFIWVSEKDGWRHIYRISRDGKTENLLTKGNYDIGVIKAIDETNGYIYFTASPEESTQQYLYRVKLDIKKNAADKGPELLSDAGLKGNHEYSIAPKAKYATHSFSNYNTPPVTEWVSLPDNKPLNPAKTVAAQIKKDESMNVEYVKVTTEDNVTLDAWIRKPRNFDATKKYPVVLFVYGEPAASTVENSYGGHNNFLYDGDMAGDGYVQVAIDNRGTPVLKGAAWRKSIYRKIGTINIRDMALGFKKLMQQNTYFDPERIAVWGWSGGGASTLNLMFQYPETFKTGIAIAAVTNQLFYDNIYQERYMGLPQENREDFIKGSPLTNAKNLVGNLLYIHGTGDDNVHYANAEALLNELIKYNKQFQFMAYPNRTHNISEGPGTSQHLSTLYTAYLKKNCPPGAR